MAPRRRCAVCGSRQWRKEPSSGLITCGEGHVLENYRNETTEVNELGPHALRKRTLKSGRKAKQWQSKADPKLYHGERGRYHYYQCLQLLLRVQIKALIDAWDLPPDFETVCRDIWAIHLTLLPNPPVAEPYLYAREQYSSSKNANSGGSSSPRQDVSANSSQYTAGQDETAKEDGFGDSPSSSSESDQEESDPDMKKLLLEAEEASSSSEDSDEGDPPLRPADTDTKKRKRTQAHGAYDAPAANISVLMLACWTLRFPVMYSDFIKLIEAYDLPYLDPIRLLPQSLTLHLTKQTIQALSPHFAPKTMDLHRLTSRIAKYMHRSYGIATPEYNAAPILWRAVRYLCGTPSLYIMSKRIAKILSLPLVLHYSLAPTLRRIKSSDPDYHKYDNAPAEVSLVATVVVALKLVYGLDGRKRTPVSRDDPACALPELAQYVAANKLLDKQDGTFRNRLFSAGPDMPPALDLDDEALDEYLKFCQKALLRSVSPEHKKNENVVLRDFFPLRPEHSRRAAVDRPQPHDEGDGNRSDGIMQAMSAVRIREDSNDLRPAQSYKIYHAQDVLGTLPEDLELLIGCAAKWAAVEDEYISGVVEKYERRLARWWDKERRAEREEGENEID